MAGYIGGSGGGPDYVQPDQPSNPDVGDEWFDTDADPDGDGTAEGEYLVYGADGNWHVTGYVDHRNLTNVVQDSHHQYPVPTAGIAASAVTASEIADGAVGPVQASLGNGIHGSGDNIAVDAGSGLGFSGSTLINTQSSYSPTVVASGTMSGFNRKRSWRSTDDGIHIYRTSDGTDDGKIYSGGSTPVVVGMNKPEGDVEGFSYEVYEL